MGQLNYYHNILCQTIVVQSSAQYCTKYRHI